MILIFALLLKEAFTSEPHQAYIAWSDEKIWVQRIEWEVKKLQRAAQDLPASIEVVIRRLFRDVKPQVEAKSV